METFGERLKRFRKEKGLTQIQISEALNIHEQTVSRWERDKSEPDMSMFAALSQILGVSLEELWGIPAEEGVEKDDLNGNFDTVRFGKMICAERRRTNESQNTLAEALKVSSDTVSKWERGVICPDLSMFLLLAEHFGISPVKLYYAGEEYGGEPEESESDLPSGMVSENAETTAGKNPKKFIILLSAAVLLVLMTGGILLGSFLLNRGNQPVCVHSYGHSAVPATCTEQGYTTYTCTLCGDSYKSDYIPMLSHSESEWIVDETASCTL